MSDPKATPDRESADNAVDPQSPDGDPALDGVVPDPSSSGPHQSPDTIAPATRTSGPHQEPG